ncbi:MULTISPECIES: amphi-Trp domain-containing protein [unclassified Pseudodesulfovibrio]|uniref:amphi-Trp domain-containing protein n=1 Tax=unclassified Pseudodesulfovibrio TaxID=2661612 RepID=UPI000FEBABFC|nr:MULTISPECIES: amphi-Trp domain-containing protein [unclassified Pseudodesulfovibrio]MCJ2164401.1 amphi-Trp domain-containing protein [Pseudodesulfovibrio sp. S3-i]RWU04607.1 amphi-Trp domain-containing protein [Pseudodesulfovibrio sp. S3]
MADDKFIFDSLQDSDTIKAFLQALTEGFDKGSITLDTNGDEIHLSPKGLLSFTVKARKKGNENKLSIKIAWKENASALSSQSTALTVS